MWFVVFLLVDEFVVCRCVLVVDDNVDVVESILVYLWLVGYEVCIVLDGL